MKERTNVRIYGRLLREWRTDYRVEQLEYEYTDYTEDGRVVGRGTEDFSLERWNKQTRLFWVWTWDGVKRNAGGKTFDAFGAHATGSCVCKRYDGYRGYEEVQGSGTACS